MKAPRLLLLAALLLGTACARRPSPDALYVAALEYKLAGDSHRYYDTLIELAHTAPHTRAGRRARVTLQGGDALTHMAMVGALAAFAAPSYEDYQKSEAQTEAKEGLLSLGELQAKFFVERGAYCKTFDECGWSPPEAARYCYFLSLDEVSGCASVPGSSAAEQRENARNLLAAMQITPHADDDSFLAAAVGNVDSDDDPDVWVITENNSLVHALNDLE